MKWYICPSICLAHLDGYEGVIETKWNGMDCGKEKIHNGVMVEQGGLWDMGMVNFRYYIIAVLWAQCTIDWMDNGQGLSNPTLLVAGLMHNTQFDTVLFFDF